ncbi:L-threonylcarbamoyladenylate synthase [Alteromonas oceanisediminis]|uniref:L-threonylcarbamoyladenylate synthase n=1 Tax=Alteromonas oceanisediminis TaxID=2836180 RepID=UPI001BDB0222|nr:L-threonylcarbamoyladenylate synthase [Alteromonas oceanisediminis]MBT0585932.1 threonylcarbamoyl-AMP synthase [Alteromonas oceanisediminis]
MNTLLLNNTANDIDHAATLLKNGGVVAVPTETVYGLAADASDPVAVNKIFTAKQRPNNHPLIVHIHSLAQLEQLTVDVPQAAFLLANAFWPGPLTMLLNKSDAVIEEVNGGLTTVGVRMPDHPVLRALLMQSDLFVAAPSANPHKQLSPTTAQHVFNELQGKIDAVIDGGPCNVGVESTIIDLTPLAQQQPARILRAGPLTATMLSAVLGTPVINYQAHQQQVPGNIAQHYQPKGKLRVAPTAELVTMCQQWPDSTACVAYSDNLINAMHSTGHGHALMPMQADKAKYARALYAALYDLDRQGFAHIWVEQPPQSEAWDDVNDRLSRAGA